MSLENCVGICTDGATPMVGSIRGFASLVQKERENPDVTTHCFIHREALVSRSLGVEMKNVLDDAIKMVNFIKDQFAVECLKKLCENLKKRHINPLLHTEIRCLSRGRVLNRVFELKGELPDYFQEKSKPDFVECFEDDE
jgi:hypothetical protein